MEHQEKEHLKIYTRYNFFNKTYCVFKGVSLREISRRKPNYRSESGSTYYYTKLGVYRLSNHWGRAAKCQWRLVSDLPAEIDDLRLGFANWEDFRENLDPDVDAYYISVDFETKKVSYMHKDNPDYDTEAVLRPADATRKLIKQIKNLLETHKWAKYYDYEDLEEFREEVITRLINSDITLNELRRELV
ncbi:hypothetical protein [Aquimarina muelleri]|uniref:Uncharacterized protein n=1 Tax=Aquimarina muelleri TaxID=279356 RepID=A0A918N0N7_9FLAO|nr:hypothetical protein [Aquimarina muelleri]MCX2762388.1 hypothetical protein [Aquimarina muelleri]GGX03912.1 hypothetical protein GCM10007384_02100 [Aquimarina muelleri]